jgi:hypothetical protein
MSTQPPPGLYQDPNDPGRQRWWDGVAWTEHQAAAPQPASLERSSDYSRTNPWAVVSLISALFGVSVVAIIAGHVAISQINRADGRERGKGMAIAGALIGWTVLSIVLGFVVYYGFVKRY